MYVCAYIFIYIHTHVFWEGTLSPLKCICIHRTLFRQTDKQTDRSNISKTFLLRPCLVMGLLCSKTCPILTVWHLSAILSHFFFTLHSHADISWWKLSQWNLPMGTTSSSISYVLKAFHFSCLTKTYLLPFLSQQQVGQESQGGLGTVFERGDQTPVYDEHFREEHMEINQGYHNFGNVNVPETSWPGHSQSLKTMDQLGELVLASKKNKLLLKQWDSSSSYESAFI